MESNLLVSVIIPVFNVRPYLNEVLDSVFFASTFWKKGIFIMQQIHYLSGILSWTGSG